MAGPYCQALKQQLMAIYEPFCFETTGATPFQLDALTCEPNAHNIYKVSMWCGWECRNTFDYTGALEKKFGGGVCSQAAGNRARGLGEPDAEYGTPRSGVGWRDQQVPDQRDVGDGAGGTTASAFGW